jgi:hypothetical protein
LHFSVITVGRLMYIKVVLGDAFSLGFNLLTLSSLFDIFLAPCGIGIVRFTMDNSGGIMVDDTEQDDGIIELTQVVGENSSDAPGQDVIELTEIDTPEEEAEENDLGMDLDLDAGEADTDEPMLFDDSDVDFDLDMDEIVKTVSEKEDDVSEPALTMAPIDEEVIDEEAVPDIGSTITQEQMDAALERVIEKKFANKIEKILFEVIEKVLKKEIVDIRQRLQKDLDEIANS